MLHNRYDCIHSSLSVIIYTKDGHDGESYAQTYNYYNY